MDPTIAQLLAHAASQGGNIFILMCGGGGAGDKGEVEPVEGPGMDGTAAHESAEGEPPEPAEIGSPSAAIAAPKPAAKPAPKAPPKPKNSPIRGEQY